MKPAQLSGPQLRDFLVQKLLYSVPSHKPTVIMFKGL